MPVPAPPAPPQDVSGAVEMRRPEPWSLERELMLHLARVEREAVEAADLASGSERS